VLCVGQTPFGGGVVSRRSALSNQELTSDPQGFHIGEALQNKANPGKQSSRLSRTVAFDSMAV